MILVKGTNSDFEVMKTSFDEFEIPPIPDQATEVSALQPITPFTKLISMSERLRCLADVSNDRCQFSSPFLDEVIGILIDIHIFWVGGH